MDFEATNKTIYKTTNYHIFKKLEGNRGVDNARVVKLMESIKRFGWLNEPILVNEKFEVIDGQGRLEALKRLGMSVEFIIREGIGIEECRAMNLFQKNWSTGDFIDSYRDLGNENYAWLKAKMKQFPELTNSIIWYVCATKGGSKGISDGGGCIKSIIESGELHLSKEERNNAEDLMFFLSRFSDTIKYLGGKRDRIYSALTFLYRLEGVDNERLVRTFNNAKFELISAGTVEGWLKQIEDYYNLNLSNKNKVDMVHEYKIA